MSPEMTVQFAALKEHPRYSAAECRPYRMWNDPGSLIVIPDLPLPPGWDRSSVTMGWWVSDMFSYARPKCMWTTEEVMLHGGRIPQWTQHGHIDWAYPEGFKVLWHREPREWSPLGDTLTTAAHFMRLRFQTLR